MINKITITLFLTLFVSFLYGQNRKFTFIEGGGSGVLINVNFDMRFQKDQSDGLGFKAGVGYFPFDRDVDILTLPIGINYLIGKNRNYLLLGANTTFVPFGKNNDRVDVKTVVPSLEVGYRFVPLKKGFSFQATYNPLFNTVDGLKPLFFGIGLGYSWK